MNYYLAVKDGVFFHTSCPEGNDPLHGNRSWSLHSGPFPSLEEALDAMVEAETYDVHVFISYVQEVYEVEVYVNGVFQLAHFLNPTWMFQAISSMEWKSIIFHYDSDIIGRCTICDVELTCSMDEIQNGAHIDCKYPEQDVDGTIYGYDNVILGIDPECIDNIHASFVQSNPATS